VGAEDRLIRIVGNERPIDVFYIPNELEAADFERYVVAEHDEVNILENQVEQDGLGVLMRFHPVASDLREFISAMKISTK
jgi:phosphate uptake regulator